MPGKSSTRLRFLPLSSVTNFIFSLATGDWIIHDTCDILDISVPGSHNATPNTPWAPKPDYLIYERTVRKVHVSISRKLVRSLIFQLIYLLHSIQLRCGIYQSIPGYNWQESSVTSPICIQQSTIFGLMSLDYFMIDNLTDEINFNFFKSKLELSCNYSLLQSLHSFHIYLFLLFITANLCPNPPLPPTS